MNRPVSIGFNGVVREGDPKALTADAGLARALGFEPQVPLREGLRRFALWFAGLPAPSPV